MLFEVSAYNFAAYYEKVFVDFDRTYSKDINDKKTN